MPASNTARTLGRAGPRAPECGVRWSRVAGHLRVEREAGGQGAECIPAWSQLCSPSCRWYTAFTNAGRGQRDVTQSLSLGAQAGDTHSLDQTLGRIPWTSPPSLDFLASVFISALSSFSKNRRSWFGWNPPNSVSDQQESGQATSPNPPWPQCALVIGFCPRTPPCCLAVSSRLPCCIWGRADVSFLLFYS